MHKRLSSTIWLLVVIGLLLAGCSLPNATIQRTLFQGQGVYLPSTSTKPVTITAIEVVDARPADELEPLKPTQTALIPLLPLLYVDTTAGHLRPRADLYSRRVVGELRALVDESLEHAGLLKERAPGVQEVKMRVVLERLYGTTYGSSHFMLLALVPETASASGGRNSFAPHGYAAGVVELYAPDGALLGRRHISASAVLENTTADEVGDQLTMAAVHAAARLAGEVARVTESMLSEVPSIPDAEIIESPFFYIARHTRDGDYLEVARIEYETGTILSSEIVKRWMEPFAAPEEWVVDPYFGSRSRLTSEQYARLIERIRAKYDVGHVDNIRVAHLFGMAAAGELLPPAPTAAGHEPAAMSNEPAAMSDEPAAEGAADE